MTKLVPIFIDGKTWIQLAQLSADQALSLRTFLPMGSFKKILFQGIELNDCISFEAYEIWFRSKQVLNQKQAFLDF
jgi:hypothetical protein